MGALQALCHAQGTQVAYVKPHGALYNQMMKHDDIFAAVVKAVALLESELPLMMMAMPDNAKHIRIAEQYHVSLLFEAFCDRAYDYEGNLVSRQQAGAVFSDIEKITAQASQLINQQSVTSLSGHTLPIHADTLCIHGDGDLALPSAQAIRAICD